MAPKTPTPPASDAPPYTNTAHVKDGDLGILTVVGVLAMSMLVIFGVAIYWSGLLEFPALAQDVSDRDYLNDTLVYRERRMALALVMRTFLTGFSFVVGLALCTMGGLFILRQVTSLTSLSGNVGGAGGAVSGLGARMMAAEDSTPKEVADRLQKTQFSFASYSPGVLFMLGGVVIMVVTQLLAIPVRAVEIVPQGAASLCEDMETGHFVTCSGNVAVPGDQDARADSPANQQTAMSFTSDDTASTFATSTAIVEQAPQSALPPQIFVLAEVLSSVELPEGYAVTGLGLNEVLIEGNGLSLYYTVADLDFSLPDWGLDLPQ